MQSVVRHGRWPWSSKSNPDEQQPVLVHDRMQFFSWQVGNMIFWLFFSILGQPMCVLLYYHDLMNRKGKTESSWHKLGRACQDQQKAWLWECFFPRVLQEKRCWAVLYRDVFFFFLNVFDVHAILVVQALGIKMPKWHWIFIFLFFMLVGWLIISRKMLMVPVPWFGFSNSYPVVTAFKVLHNWWQCFVW